MAVISVRVDFLRLIIFVRLIIQGRSQVRGYLNPIPGMKRKRILHVRFGTGLCAQRVRGRVLEKAFPNAFAPI